MRGESVPVSSVAIKQFAATHMATLNDTFLTAFVRAIPVAFHRWLATVFRLFLL